MTLQQVGVAELAHDDWARAVVDRELGRVGAVAAAEQAVAADDRERAGHRGVTSTANADSAPTSASACARCRSPRSPRAYGPMARTGCGSSTCTPRVAPFTGL